MDPDSAHPRYQLIEYEAGRDDFAEAVREGLLHPSKTLPFRFFYDHRGSQLFEEICRIPEYYPTRCEREILEQRADEIAEHFEVPITLAELGSGSASKTTLLIEAFQRRQERLQYIPADISRSALEASSQGLLERYPKLEIVALCAEYEQCLRHIEKETLAPKLIAWLGSSVGNLSLEEATRFLIQIRSAMASGDGLLMGVDLHKSAVVLERAYDDAAGVTARFNKNLLDRIDRELAGEFYMASFSHVARWNEAMSRVEMHLRSDRKQRVRIAALGIEVSFDEGETIHTENSHKYSMERIENLVAASDLTLNEVWTDAQGYFALVLATAGTERGNHANA
ncbi:L-histidine N(alpha)-methyltransferase [Myxococcota bacterium]|nr:L-histidine N(alpha)-methyltransferase [Myxococcota bacterium]